MNQKPSIDYIQKKSSLVLKIPLHGIGKNGRPSITDLVLFEKQKREQLLQEQDGGPPQQKNVPIRYVKSIDIVSNQKSNELKKTDRPLIKSGVD